MNIRQANQSDASRIAEMIVINYRKNFFPILKNEEFYFGELNVIDVAKEYMENENILQDTYVYDDGVVKGMIRLKQDEVLKLYVEPHFQGENIGSTLLNFAVSDKGANWLWVLEQNQRGIEFYKKNGFDFTGDTMVEDEWIPLKKMQLCKL
ncbi:MAG: GNAT family N-acetyltransferase [Lachnospiraceae bacterium]|nr:GNAT family N-acetyltransferase [Lachnospiraceae bacterium]